MTPRYLMLLILFFWSVNAQASLIFVDTLEDELNSDGDCSLREAVKAANDNMAVDDCTTGGALVVDQIFILLAGEIELESSLVITEQVEIIGSGREQLTIKSRPDYLVALIKVDMTNTEHGFKLEALTLKDGGTRPEMFQSCCGALQLQEGDTFRIEDVAFINNQNLIETTDLFWAGGGAIFAGPLLNSETPRLIIEDSLFEDNMAVHGSTVEEGRVGYGGAILTTQRLANGGGFTTDALSSISIARSVFRGNAAGRGGSSISVQGDTVVSITDTLFEDNLDPWDNDQIPYSGGTLHLTLYAESLSTLRNSSFVRNEIDELAGVVVLVLGNLVVDNSTFWGNNSPPLIAQNDSILAVNYSTMVNNGDGASLEATDTAAISMRGSIVWHDNAVSAECNFDGGTTYTSLGHNIDSGTNCSPHATDSPETNPMLAPLDFYGDTIADFDLPTLLPSPGGPAVDAAELNQCSGSVGAFLTLDQRGETRPVDGAESGANLCDIGAVEYQFEQDPEFGELTVQTLGTGSVVSNKGGINCPDECSAVFIEQTVVRLTATAGSGHEFVSWGGACSGTGLCQVQIANSKTVTASFQAKPLDGPIFKNGFEDL